MAHIFFGAITPKNRSILAGKCWPRESVGGHAIWLGGWDGGNEPGGRSLPHPQRPVSGFAFGQPVFLQKAARKIYPNPSKPTWRWT